MPSDGMNTGQQRRFDQSMAVNGPLVKLLWGLGMG